MYNFLKGLDLENLVNILVKNGFDDVSMMIDQMKSNHPITHDNFRKIGLSLPGQRAKILMKLEEGKLNVANEIRSEKFFI